MTDIFMKVKKYDTPVWKSRVPLLTDYLADAARAVGEQLSQVRCCAFAIPRFHVDSLLVVWIISVSRDLSSKYV